MLTALCLQDLTQAAHRPAATRQLGVQHGVAAGHGGTRDAGQCIGMPDGITEVVYTA